MNATTTVATQTAAQPEVHTTSRKTLCHCGKEYWNQLGNCPFCYCGTSQSCIGRRLLAKQEQERRDAEFAERQQKSLAIREEREANCQHRFVEIPRQTHRSGLHRSRCENGCGAIKTVDTSD